MPPPPRVTGTPTFKAPPLGRVKPAQPPPPSPLPKLEEGDEGQEEEDDKFIPPPPSTPHPEDVKEELEKAKAQELLTKTCRRFA